MLSGETKEVRMAAYKESWDQEWHSSGRKLLRAILMEVGLDLKLVSCRHGHIFEHFEPSKAISRKIKFSYEGKKMCMAACFSFHRQRQPQDYR